MWRITLRDMQWRRRRFAIAIIGTSLVFAMTLVLSGMAAGFDYEIDRTLGSIGADRWVVNAGVTGPFTATAFIPEATASVIGGASGVTRADPLIYIRQTVHPIDHADQVRDVNLFGFVPGGIGEPKLEDGVGVRQSGDAVVDRTLNLSIGDRFAMSGHTFRVTGTLSGMTLNGTVPDSFVGLADTQALAFGGQHVVTAVLTRGVPSQVPTGLAALDAAAVRSDVARPLGPAHTSITLLVYLLRTVAATIIASVVYLSASERVRDFAVLKATGTSSQSVIAGVAIQAMFLAVASALLAIGVALLLVPTFPLAIHIPASDLILLPVVALVVGILASAAGARRAVAVDPALAFSGP